MSDCEPWEADFGCMGPVEPYSYMTKVVCTVCQFVFVGDTESRAKVAAYTHVVREHPDVYTRVVGHAPRANEVAETVYALLEDIVPFSEIGPFP